MTHICVIGYYRVKTKRAITVRDRIWEKGPHDLYLLIVQTVSPVNSDYYAISKCPPYLPTKFEFLTLFVRIFEAIKSKYVLHMLTLHTWTRNIRNMDTLTQLVFYADTCSITCLLKWSVDKDTYVVDKLRSSTYSGHKKSNCYHQI